MNRKINLIMMGKTGAGKSTIVNCLLGENVAETGIGKRITQENRKYEKRIIAGDGLPMDVSIYDTVGLEIDDKVTAATITKIEEHLGIAEKECLVDDVTAVWFCVNWKCNRFEKYELDLIKRLSVDNCIPFIIVLTQCPDNSIGELERDINNMLPEIPVMRILAKDSKSRIGVHKAYGLQELLSLTIREYPHLKIQMAETKILKVQKRDNERIQRLKSRGETCIRKYTEKAGKAGWVPALSIPFIHGMRNKMMDEMNDIFALKIPSEKVEAIVVGAVLTPFMIVPGISKIMAEAYVETIGESYLKALMELVNKYANYEQEKNEVILETIKQSLGG